MPNGAYNEELNNIASFREYMATHVESWYRWAKRRGREVQNGDIRLVIGHDKATSWGMACFSNTSKHQRCQLTFSQNEESERATGCSYAWEHTGTSVDVKAGPDYWDTQDLRQSNDPPLLNQCLFLRTLNALLSDDLWASMQMHGAPALNVQGSANSSSNSPKSPKQNSTDNSETSTSSRTTNSASRDQGPSQRRSQHEERSCSEDTEYALRHAHPSYAINAWLLKETEIGRALKPKMVITDDPVWGSLGSMVNAFLDPSEDPDLVKRCFDQVLDIHDIQAIRSDSSVTMCLNPKDSTDRARAQGLARAPALMGVSRENSDDNFSYSVVPVKSTAYIEAFTAFFEDIVFGPARKNSIILDPPRHYIKGTALHSQQDEVRLRSGSYSPTEFVLDLCSVFHLQNRRLLQPIDLRSLLKALPAHRNLDYAATFPGFMAYVLKRSNSLASELQSLYPLLDDGNDPSGQADGHLVSPLYGTGGGFRGRSLNSRQTTSISLPDNSKIRRFPRMMVVLRTESYSDESILCPSSMVENPFLSPWAEELDYGYAERKKRKDDAYRMIIEYLDRNAPVDNGTKVATHGSGPSPASIDSAKQSSIYPRGGSKPAKFAYDSTFHTPVTPPPLTFGRSFISALPPASKRHNRVHQVDPALRSSFGREAGYPSLDQGRILPSASSFIEAPSRLSHFEDNQFSHTRNAPLMRLRFPLENHKYAEQDRWKEGRMLSQAEFRAFPSSFPQERQGQFTLFTQEVGPGWPSLFPWQRPERSVADRPRLPQNSLDVETRWQIVQQKPDMARCTEHGHSNPEVGGAHQEFDCVPQFFGFDASSSFDDPQNPAVLVMSAEHRRFSVATEQRKTEKEPSLFFRTM
ncbi:hypothetical protein BJ165DRAFT_432070 [Panaeolus papilionaceus]|nr:hypothetical protein BJ165DRAFT_432070 [Panaeolus papilionaceus]